MECPDENTLVAFASGELAPTALEWVATHVDGCGDCAALVADAAQVEDFIGPTRITGASSTENFGDASSLVMEGPLPRGTQLGRYVVLDLLGSGGLGDVYAAYDPQLDRRVALKLMRPSASLASSEAQRWLQREAQAMAQLSHPHVVPVHDVGTHEGSMFVAMDLVTGGTLRDWLRAQERSWREVRDVLYEAGEGLQAAHGAGLVHRDFKPGNVLVDEAGHAFVVDFGLARAVGFGSEGKGADERVDALANDGDRLLDQDLTETGAVVGTPAYMAPEQLAGIAVGARSDQFAFCVTLWEGLFGARPFTGKTLREIQEAIGRGPPVVTGSGVPAWLRRAVARGLCSDEDARFGSMGELLEAITVDRRSRRRQWMALGLVAIISASVAGGLGLWLKPEPTPQERDAVDATVVAAREAAARACFVYPPEDDPDFLTAYARVLELEQVQGPAAEQAQQQAQVLRQEFADTLVGLGDSYWDRAGGNGFASDYYAAALLFDPSREQARARVHMTPGQLGSLAGRAATMSFSEGELAAADALAALADPDPDARKERLIAWVARGDAPMTTQVQLEQLHPELWSREEDGPADMAVAMVPAGDEDVVEHGEGMGEQKPSLSEGARSRRSRRSSPRGGSALAAEPPRNEPGVADDASAPRDPAAAKAEVVAGRAALKQGRVDAAAGHFHRALEHDHRSTGALVGLSDLHFQRGQYSQAVAYGEQAIRQSPRSARARLLLGDAYFKVLRYADARRQYTKAQELGDEFAPDRLMMLDKKTGGGE